MKIHILCVGNSARGDDAAGELMHQWLSERLTAQPRIFGNHQVALLCDFQLQPEHIYDLQDCDMAIFIDCQYPSQEPVCWQPVRPANRMPVFNHSLDMATLLYLFEYSFAQPAPPCFLLGIGGECFDLGAAPSRNLVQHLTAAKHLLQDKIIQLSS